MQIEEDIFYPAFQKATGMNLMQRADLLEARRSELMAAA